VIELRPARELELGCLAALFTAAADVDVAHERIRSLRLDREPWQRDDDTLARLRALDPVPEAFLAEGGAAIVRQTAQAVSVVQIAGDTESTGKLLEALRGRGSVNVLNLPEDEPAAIALRELGGRAAVQQRELVLRF
jgi:hypothetical protein